MHIYGAVRHTCRTEQHVLEERGGEATKKKKKKCSAGSVHQTHTAGTGPFGLVCVTNPKGPVPRPSGTRIRVQKRGLLLNGDIDK